MTVVTTKTSICSMILPRTLRTTTTATATRKKRRRNLQSRRHPRRRQGERALLRRTLPIYLRRMMMMVMTTMTTTKRKKKMEMPRERPSDLVVIAMMARARMTRRMIKLRRKTQKRTMAAKARRRNAPKSAFLTKKPRLVTMTTRTTTCRMEHTKIQMTWFASTTQRKISGRSTEMKRRKQSLLNKIVVGSVPGGGWEVWEGWMEGKMMIIVMLLVLPGSWRRGTGWKEG
mmetsp:Transcript_24374/g.50019  ORF Transcript_24374/g.50019 Transcript_24374/m.50019 type:complete len:230 (+) Transcript_24374:443-1132(+)